MKLYKTLVIIWSDVDPLKLPASNVPDRLVEIAKQADAGDAFISDMTITALEHPAKEPDVDWDETVNAFYHQRDFDTPQENCPMCNSQDIVNEDAPDDNRLEVRCCSCGFVWLEPAEERHG